MKTQLLHSVKAMTVMAVISGAIAINGSAAAITTQSDIVTTTIDIRDLETDRGLAKIYKSLTRRAKKACTASGAKSVSTRVAEQTCTKNLLIEFVQNVDDVRLTRYHEKMQS